VKAFWLLEIRAPTTGYNLLVRTLPGSYRCSLTG